MSTAKIKAAAKPSSKGRCFDRSPRGVQGQSPCERFGDSVSKVLERKEKHDLF